MIAPLVQDKLHSHSVQYEHDHAHDCGHGAAHDHTPQPLNTSALLSGRGLTLSRQGRNILLNVDFDLCAKEIVTLIGPNGAGKSTLVKVLLGLEKADGGQVHRDKNLRVGYVPQKLSLDQTLPMTVQRFLTLGTSAGALDIKQKLTSVGAPQVLGRQLSRLSGGELQRVMLARALLRDPNVLVLDEPLAGIDYSGETELYELVADLRDSQNLGILLVSHDLHVVMSSSDRVVCLNRHVCCSGKPIAVAQHEEYAKLFGENASRAFAVYEHRHDHAHDLAGDPLDVRGDVPVDRTETRHTGGKTD